jgi:hypothetical protein
VEEASVARPAIGAGFADAVLARGAAAAAIRGNGGQGAVFIGEGRVRSADLANVTDADGFDAAGTDTGDGIAARSGADSGSISTATGGIAAEGATAAAAVIRALGAQEASRCAAPFIPRSNRIESDSKIVAAIPMGSAQRGERKCPTGMGP